jgi:hypothetical protein
MSWGCKNIVNLIFNYYNHLQPKPKDANERSHNKTVINVGTNTGGGGISLVGA